MAIKQQTNTVIDIGTHSVKMIQCNKQGRIVKSAMEVLPDGCVKGLFIEAEEPLIHALKAAKHKSGISGGRCILTLSGKDMIVRHMNLPKLPEKQLYQNVLLEMASYLPVEIDKHQIDFKILEEITENDNTIYRIMVATVHKNILERFSYVLKKAGFSLKILDANENAQEKFVRAPIHTLLNDFSGKGICILDIGAETTKVNLFDEGRFFAGYLLSRGGNRITQLVSQNMKTDIITAENFKLKNDLFYDDKINENFRASVKNETDSLIYELSKVADYFWSRTGKALGCILLCGGGSRLKGFYKYLQTCLNISVVEPQKIFEKFEAKKPLSEDGYPIFFNAYAASFREEA